MASVDFQEAPTASRRTIILGEGGHARVLAAMLPGAIRTSNDDDVTDRDTVYIGIGSMHGRRRLFEKFGSNRFPKLIHPTALIEPHVFLNRGIQIMAGVILQPGTVLGDNVLVNTRAQIDHDCLIEDHCHIAPGAILCGRVTVGEGTFIGAGAVIPNNVTIPPNSFVKAGSLGTKWHPLRI